MKCVIVSGGSPPSEKLLKQQLSDADLIIGVDGAADILMDLGIKADIVIGDFDTAKKINILGQQNNGAEVIRLRVDKNETDTEAAVNLAIERGAKNIVMLGAVGTRLDHSLANVSILKPIFEQGIFAKIIDDNTEMFISDSEVSLCANVGETISILPLCSDITVSASGLKYPLDELFLPFGTSRGVSNIIESSSVSINISGGYALIVLTDGNL